ncbi:hypothetical protein EAG_05331 [Camponotus floridanus]|uniref:Uncharacterized protein n=1 Tax=Camponotus floridanus TaxID=104421 RepID=E1ZWF4_CAMFO|nr:hypothetical protein EAG_05331 [Camponotus floridanus]
MTSMEVIWISIRDICCDAVARLENADLEEVACKFGGYGIRRYRLLRRPSDPAPIFRASRRFFGETGVDSPPPSKSPLLDGVALTQGFRPDADSNFLAVSLCLGLRRLAKPYRGPESAVLHSLPSLQPGGGQSSRFSAVLKIFGINISRTSTSGGAGSLYVTLSLCGILSPSSDLTGGIFDIFGIFGTGYNITQAAALAIARILLG